MSAAGVRERRRPGTVASGERRPVAAVPRALPVPGSGRRPRSSRSVPPSVIHRSYPQVPAVSRETTCRSRSGHVDDRRVGRPAATPSRVVRSFRATGSPARWPAAAAREVAPGGGARPPDRTFCGLGQVQRGTARPVTASPRGWGRSRARLAARPPSATLAGLGSWTHDGRSRQAGRVADAGGCRRERLGGRTGRGHGRAAHPDAPGSAWAHSRPVVSALGAGPLPDRPDPTLASRQLTRRRQSPSTETAASAASAGTAAPVPIPVSKARSISCAVSRSP